MEKTIGTAVLVAAFMVVLMASVGGMVAAQPQCASKLVSCANYLNGTDMPPSSCCDPLKEAVTNEMPCLCAIYNSPSILKAFNINLQKALLLPSRCGFASDPNACRNTTGAPSATPTTPATQGSNDNSSAGNHGVKCFGMLLILFLWSVVA